MTEAIVVAIITAGASVVCQIILSRSAKKQTSAENAKREQRIDDQLLTINQKLDIHNGYAEKFADIQTDIAVIKNEIKNLKGE